MNCSSKSSYNVPKLWGRVSLAAFKARFIELVLGYRAVGGSEVWECG